MIINSQAGGHHTIFADSLREAVEFVQRTPSQWPQADSRNSRARHEWDLNAGWSGALQLARDGWTTGVADLLVLAKSVPHKETRPKDSFDVGGERPDIGRYLAGEPMHMRSRGKTTSKLPVVHIVIDMCFSASVTATAYKEYGAAMLAIIDNLENRGKRVELDVIYSRLSRTSRKRTPVGWKVKKASEPLDINDVAFSLAHPAAFRRIGFAMWERTAREHHSYGYGAVCSDQSDCERIGSEGAFFIGGIGPTAVGMTGAVKRATEQVNKAAGQEIVTWEA